MKRRVITAVLIACVAIALVWQAGSVLLSSGSSAQLNPPAFNLVFGAEPISPIPRSLPLDARKIALGKRLFHDPRLSRDDSVACSSCHDLARGGADGRKTSSGVSGQRAERNAPTVFNAVFNFRQFWDGRAATLEDQIDGPVNNPKEMASSWPAVIAKLGGDREYRAAFQDIYGAMEPGHVKNAIAEFERSLLTPGSRFDRYLDGDRKALTDGERAGYQLFKSYGCIACHQGVNVGGNLYQRLGVLRVFAEGTAGGVDPADVGRMAITRKREDLLVFKVPSLRNVALTAPYFHDGSVEKLEQAVVLMGQYQLGVAIPRDDVARIVQFLHTLTGDLKAGS
jgi:cytochrome c peroxidase